MPSSQPVRKPADVPAKRFLPPIGSSRYYILLGAIAILILGPLGGITAAYMNFSLGFFVGGQVLAGILGSVVTYGYGAEGKHGANYMQTMAASVASLSGMAVLIQAMVWLGLPEPPVWQLVLYFLCIGMFGVGIGMLYTPVLVDQMRLAFPSGFAVANILRALTDVRILKTSIAKLGGGTLAGLVGGLGGVRIPQIATSYFSASTVGAGMIVGVRIGIPAVFVGAIGLLLTPWLRTHGWLGPDDPFRKIGFIAALGMILGAAIVDMSLLAFRAVRAYRETQGAKGPPAEDWKRTDTRMLWIWVAFWGLAVLVTAVGVLHLPAGFVIVAIGLVFVFLMVNGISLGISDSNPISSAFVVTVFLLAALGLKSPITGLMCASILLISTSVGCDMQQDRSTGWRLGTNRSIQFRYQVIGVTMGSVMAVALARLFMKTYPILAVNQYANPGTPGIEKWQSAMTFKFVGALEGIAHPNPHVMIALALGVMLGVLIETIRKMIKRRPDYQGWVRGSRSGALTDLALDCTILASPYAASFGGFVEFPVSAWFAGGSVISSGAQALGARAAKRRPGREDLPEDMSTTSLVGGGLIAGDSLAALGLGLWGLLRTVF
ncbi:MAG: OPT/YSL family transporter [Candidatus Eisenbacteria bacterium]|nr:OPT/YSL family transporter [Candidatus Eisenbacteria bacterium]